jgi:cytochrome P450
MGRNKSVRGIDAEQFVPERWLVSSADDAADGPVPPGVVTRNDSGPQVSPFGKFKPESQFKFIAFNAGPRLHLGTTFAQLEDTTVTCILLRKYSFELMPGCPEPMVKGSITLKMKRALMTVVSKRVC